MATSNKLNIATFNINGMRATETQAELKQICESHNFDILLLQETHFDTKYIGKAIEQELSYKSFWSFGTSRSCGVGILLSDNLSYTLEKYEYDFDGRFLFIDIKIGEIPYRIINIYAPNKEKDRKEYFLNLSQFLVANRNIIVGGDFNCVENSRKDKFGRDSNPDFGTTGSKELKTLTNDFQITDSFRKLNPNMIASTWHAAGKQIHARLDRFYISNNMLNDDITFDFLPTSVSDHDIFAMNINPQTDVKFGQSYWKFNDQLLLDNDFITAFSGFLNYQIKYLNLTLETWDKLKHKIRLFCIAFSKKKSRLKHDNIRKLRFKYSNLVQAERVNPGNYLEQIETLRLHIKTVSDENNAGAKVRAKIKTLETEEIPSNYFNKIEKRRCNKKTVRNIKYNNKEFTKSEDILNCFRSFYSDLYTEEAIDGEVADTFLKDLPQLTPEDADSLENDFTIDELSFSLQSMQDGKSPGPDGLTKAFYSKFFGILAPLLLKLTVIIFESGNLSDTQKLSYITLICKNDDKSDDVKFYRPISLLNYDYKIISKSITQRLSTVLGSIIHEDQTCSVKGRTILDNVHLMRNIIDYVDQKDMECIFLNLDQEKAFDRVSYAFLYKCLETFGFRPNFIKWIQILYNNIKSSVIVNNHISDPFNISRGVRQGCALSPLLYVLILEPFANQIRRNPLISGISLPGSADQSKISLYADDSTATLTNLKSVQIVLDTCKLFGKASGSKLNIYKTKGMFLGKWKTRSDHPFGISWIEHAKLLGRRLGSFITEDDTWSTTFSKYQKTINQYSTRHISLKGKSIISNSLACSKLWYLCSTTLLPKHYKQLFTRSLFSFIWKSKSEHLNRKTMYLPYNKGGQNIVDIETKANALLLKHIQTLLDGHTAKWTYFTIYWIGLSLRKFNPAFASLTIPHSDYVPPFYEHCLSLLREFNKKAPKTKLNNLPCKEIYKIMLNYSVVFPPIISKRPRINFTPIWKTLQNKCIDPFSRDVSWKIIHEILPVQQVLYFRKITKDAKCPLCGYSSESVHHLFFHCPTVQLLYSIVFPWISDIAEITITPSIDIVIYNILPRNLDTSQRDTILYILSDCKFSIWASRNLKKFEKRKVNSCYILMFMLNKMKLRIQADYKRYDLNNFNIHWSTLVGLDFTKDDPLVFNFADF
ncbi:MAG: reverse transcriptase domain-containing protein [Sedimenticola sp.]